MSRKSDGVWVQRTEERNFNWSDTDYIFQFQNKSGMHIQFERIEVINGSTAGTTTAAKVYLDTPTMSYRVTMPGAGTMPVNGVGSLDAIGQDLIMPDGMVTAIVNTAPSAAKEGKLRVTFSYPA